MYKSLFRKEFIFYIIVILIGTVFTSSSIAIVEKQNYSLSIYPNGKTFYVGGSGPDNYTRIQEAIDDATDGDIVFVYTESSPYYENIVIDKSILLIGENPSDTIIDGNFSDCTIYINSSDVFIFGFSIKHGNLSGIKIWRSKYCVITNNIIQNNKRYGISLIESCNNSIEVNYIKYNDNGIKLSSKSNFNVFEGNEIKSNNNGIYLEDSSENILTANEISNNEYGIKLYSRSRKNLIELNSISNNSIGIFLGGTIYPTFAFNILLDGSIHNKITKNNFIENVQDAYFQNSRRNRWWRNYWNESKILPKLIFGELFICRLQGIPPTAIEHHIPWIPRLDLRPALKPFSI